MHTQSLFPASFLSNPVIKGSDFESPSHSRRNGLDHDALEHKPKRDDDTFKQSSPTKGDALSQIRSAMSFHSLEKSLSQSADVQIKTQEGDVISISFQSLAESSKTAFQLDQGNTQIRAYGESQSSKLDFSISIKGDLNEDEQKAIHQLMQKIKKVSKEFFQGDINAAFEHAQKLGFNSQQISSFSLDLNRTESVQAVAAYKQTSFPAQSVNADLLQQASDFLAETKNLLADSAVALESLAEPKQSFSDLFANIGALFSGVEKADKANSEASLFLDMVENLANEQFDKKSSDEEIDA